MHGLSKSKTEGDINSYKIPLIALIYPNYHHFQPFHSLISVIGYQAMSHTYGLEVPSLASRHSLPGYIFCGAVPTQKKHLNVLPDHKATQVKQDPFLSMIRQAIHRPYCYSAHFVLLGPDFTMTKTCLS